jgi:hypothetical protein
MQENDAKVWSSRALPLQQLFYQNYAKEELVKSMMDVVSHEFFHIVTPLAFILKKSKISIIMTLKCQIMDV